MVAANDNTTEQPEVNPEVPVPQEENAEEAEVELTKEQKLAAIPTLMSEGQRAYLTNDLELAVEKFSVATEYAVSAYEDAFAPECFEPHYMYGRALTGLAELESEDPQVEFDSVRAYISKMAEERTEKLQGAKEQPALDDDSIIGNPDEITGGVLGEERDEIVAAVDTALEENAQELDKLGEKSEETMEDAEAEKEEPTVEADAEEKPMEATEEEAKEAADATVEADPKEDAVMDETIEGAEEDAEMEEGEEEEDGVDSANIAWEVLEVARKICEKHGESKEWDLKKAQVLSVLGQLSITGDKYENAISDLQTALEITQKHLGENDRITASAYYELGVAYRSNDDYLKASELVKKAKDILVARLETLKAAGDSEEIQDLGEIIKDVTSAYEDCQTSYKDNEKKKALEEKEVKQISPEKPKENLEPASDITSNIRKGKRPAEDEPAKEENKKAKVEEEPATAPEIPAEPVA